MTIIDDLPKLPHHRRAQRGAFARCPFRARRRACPRTVGNGRADWRAVALAVVLASGLDPAAAHAPRQVPDGSYMRYAWGAQEGLPQLGVNDLVVDEQGLLWLATFGGLARFDGVRFEEAAVALRWPRVTALARGADGDLWLGHLSGRVTQLGDDGKATVFDPYPDLPRGNVRHLAWADGELLVSSSTGCFRLDPAAGRTFLGGPGCFLIAGPEGGLWRWVAGVLERIAPDGTIAHRLRAPGVIGLTARPEERLLWVLHHQGLSVVQGDGPLERVASIPIPANAPPPSLDADGSIWWVGEQALFHLRDPLAQPTDPRRGSGRARRFALPGDPVSLFVDAQSGGVWVGSLSGGLLHLSPVPFELRAVPPGRPDGVRGIIAAPDGGLWMTIACEGLFHVAGGSARSVLPEGCILDFDHDPGSGRLYAVSDRRLRIVEGDGRIRTLEPPISAATALHAEGEDVYVGGLAGEVVRLRNGTFDPLPSPFDDRITLIERGPEGRLHVGENGVVGILDERDAWRVLDADDGVPPAEIRAFVFSPRGLFVATYGGGIAWLDGDRPLRFDRGRGLPSDFLGAAVLVDGAGRPLTGATDGGAPAALLLNSNAGLIRIPFGQLEAVARGSQQRLRPFAYGTPEMEFGQPPWAFVEGRLLFTTLFGYVALDAAVDPARSAARPVTIDRATLDGQPLTVGGTNRVPAGPGRLTVAYTVPDYDWPSTRRFQLRLGAAEPWIVTAERQLVFEDVGPGSHVLELRAIGPEGAGPVTRLAFDLAPHWSRTPAFQLTSLLTVVLLLVTFHRWRTSLIGRHARALEVEIAQRQEAERALSEREAHYRNVFETSDNGFLLTDGTQALVDANPAALRLFGSDRCELLGTTIGALRADGLTSPMTGVARFRRADGTCFAAQHVERPVEGTGLTLHTLVDLEPLLAAQERERELGDQLARSERMAALGRLAGGVAHDVNNLLAIIQLHANLARDRAGRGRGDEAVESLGAVLEASDRIARLTRQLVEIGRPRSAPTRTFELGALLANLRVLAESLVPAEVTLVWREARGPAWLRADMTQVEQIVLNLLTNACEAVGAGGRVEIAYAVDGDGQVALTVEDDGEGMAPDVLDQIFDPFFTTKRSGTGLGLTIVASAVERAGGVCEVSSVPGQGTRFRVLLPAAEARDAPRAVPADR